MLGAYLLFGVWSSTQAQEITYPTVKHASSGQHSLSMGTAPFADYGFDSFGYDGSVPGPTFRVKPGETLAIQLTNNLLPANDVSCAQTNGEFCNAASTNLHTHGLHVSSKGISDGLTYYSDDILADLDPGSGLWKACKRPSQGLHKALYTLISSKVDPGLGRFGVSWFYFRSFGRHGF